MSCVQAPVRGRGVLAAQLEAPEGCWALRRGVRTLRCAVLAAHLADTCLILPGLAPIVLTGTLDDTTKHSVLARAFGYETGETTRTLHAHHGSGPQSK